MRKRILVLLALAALLLATVGAAAAMAAGQSSSSDRVLVRLKPVGGSGISGFVSLRQLQTDGTSIALTARSLTPGARYVSLYYDNHECALEPYSQDDVIGGPYTANRNGVGHTQGVADDDLDEVNSVSVRAANFKLLACADVHP